MTIALAAVAGFVAGAASMYGALQWTYNQTSRRRRGYIS